MFELFDEWRNRANRQAVQHPDGFAMVAEERPRVPIGGPSLEPFGTCGVCGGERNLRSEPVGGQTVRLALLCDGCGARTDI